MDCVDTIGVEDDWFDPTAFLDHVGFPRMPGEVEGGSLIRGQLEQGGQDLRGPDRAVEGDQRFQQRRCFVHPGGRQRRQQVG